MEHILQAAFNKKRIVIFSGGPAKQIHDLLPEIQDLADGGAFGSIVGRNVFQRKKEDALQLLSQIMQIYKNAK